MTNKEWRDTMLLIFVIASPLMTLSMTQSGESVQGKVTRDMVKLPKSVKPLHYNVRLQPFINGNFSIHGSEKIEFKVLIPTHQVILHMADIITKNESSKVVDKESGREIAIIQQAHEPSKSLYICSLQEELEVYKIYVLSLEFVGTLGEQPRGFYRSAYVKGTGEKSWVASTQFQSTDARRAFPCFDEPALKATFKIYLAREAHMNALSNMPVMKSTPVEDQPGWIWDEFQKSVPMSTYLVAFVISDFPSIVVSDANSTTSIRVWSREDAQDLTHYGGRRGTQLLKFFEEYFSISYPLPKLDMICPPLMNSNAMENWGLITYRESGLLFDPETGSAEREKWVSYLVAHELAHQWFGNLVTLQWWTDLWLNEGFATYMGDVAIHHVEPSWGMMDQFVVNRQQAVFALDALRSSHSVHVPVNDPVEINEIFDTISYFKGASIIRMMSYFLTEKTFKKGLKNYLTVLKYRNADQDNLWRFLTEAAHEDGTIPDDMDVKIVMDSWTMKKGFPVVSVTRVDNYSASLTQEQFFLDKQSLQREETPHRWWIPVTYTTQESPSFEDTNVKFWLSDKDVDPVSHIGFPEPHFWVVFNVKQTGYYRVNYDVENWNLLIQQLHHDHEVINIVNRAQIIDDALNLARSGRLPYEIALGVTSYLSKERSYVVWKAALRSFQYVYEMIWHDPAYGAFRDYMLSVIVPIYNQVGFEEKSDDDLDTQLLRGEIVRWACKLQHDDCVNNSVKIFGEWMNNPSRIKGASSNIAAAVYCTAVRAGDEKEWKFAWEKKLSGALACSERMWIIARYLKATFDENSGVRRQDSYNVFRKIASSSVGSILSWKYMRTYWKNITSYIGTTFFALPRMISAVTKTFNTEQDLDELMKFEVDNRGNLLTAKRAVEQAIESTKVNLAWMEENYDVIVQWLREHGFSSDLNPQRISEETAK